MEIVFDPPIEQWRSLIRRNITDDAGVTAAVTGIIDNVRVNGDEALREYARKFDKTELDSLMVSRREIEEAADRVSPEVKEAIRTAIRNVGAFHRAQLPQEVRVETSPGVTCIQRAVPIPRVGLYIPGGTAPLFSTVIMLAVPAKIAGCKAIDLFTPQGAGRPIAPEILFAAHECGVNNIYRIGGAQAIAAMAYGTRSVIPVDKIFGPGNQYVMKAKQLVSTVCAIDMPAGPSEVLVLADAMANPTFVASDMLSQAEHGVDSQAVCVCTSMEIADAVAAEVERLAAQLPRKAAVEGSLSHSLIVVMPNLEGAVEFTNLYAPEHLIISTDNPWDVASKITAAGSVFIGNFSPESAGDYASGTNHTLPTNGWARSYSGVNIDSFMRKITYQQLTQEGLRGLSGTITAMARAEGLDAHALAVETRIEYLG